MPDNAGVIPEGMVLMDGYGGVWKRSPSYQDRSVKDQGWMLLVRVDGTEEANYFDVLDHRGYSDGVRNYLKAVRM